MNEKPGWGYAGDNPVVNVNWYGATDYAKWLSEKAGHIYRLPGEVEWEFAARGGNKSQGYIYAGSDDLDEVAWYSNNSESRPRPVAGLKPNELGLYDMSGNVRMSGVRIGIHRGVFLGFFAGVAGTDFADDCRSTDSQSLTIRGVTAATSLAFVWCSPPSQLAVHPAFL